MAAEIKEKLGLEATLIGGSGGVFDVKVGDSLIYSKHQENDEFPGIDDLTRRLEALKSDS